MRKLKYIALVTLSCAAVSSWALKAECAYVRDDAYLKTLNCCEYNGESVWKKNACHANGLEASGKCLKTLDPKDFELEKPHSSCYITYQ